MRKILLPQLVLYDPGMSCDRNEKKSPEFVDSTVWLCLRFYFAAGSTTLTTIPPVLI
jgi:hypothetical protein